MSFRALAADLPVLAAGALVIAALIAPVRATADVVATTAEVLRVVDGDTIDIRDDVRGRLRVRILGIDTPETKKPGYGVACWGPEATEFATINLLGQRVAMQPDPTQDRTDRYGRTLAYLVKADGWDYSVEAARAGTAKSYVYGGVPVTRYGAIEAAQAEADSCVTGSVGSALLWRHRVAAALNQSAGHPGGAPSAGPGRYCPSPGGMLVPGGGAVPGKGSPSCSCGAWPSSPPFNIPARYMSMYRPIQVLALTSAFSSPGATSNCSPSPGADGTRFCCGP